MGEPYGYAIARMLRSQLEAHSAADHVIALEDGLASVTRERDALREALRRACVDAWSDPDAAMEHYLSNARAALAPTESEGRQEGCTGGFERMTCDEAFLGEPDRWCGHCRSEGRQEGGETDG